jgi:3-phenylpropionate/cinnamic acid dioxygenase small subunit
MSDTLKKNRMASLEEHHRISQFYFHEARLLDERQYQQWLALLTKDIVYTVPARHTPFVDPTKRETEALLNIEQEMSSGLEPPFRDDNHLTLSIRVMRAFKLNSWTDNPPARTRRFVSNIEAVAVDAADESDSFDVYSNLLLYFSRYAQDNHVYTARRHDFLRNTEAGLKIARREVLLDWNVITGPSVGLFF